MVSTGQQGKNDVGTHLLVGFRGLELEGELKGFIKNFGVGGIVLFRRNIKGPEQLRALLNETQAFAQETLGRPLWVAIDQEGGPVQRLTPPFTQLPSAKELAAQGGDAIAEWECKAASDLRRMGIQINLAPVLDVVSPETPNFMDARSLGSDPREVARLGRIWIETLQANGVSATAKHYPGLGQAELDPHHFAPVIRWQNDEAMQRDLLPFREAIGAGVHCVMTSHALYPFLDPQWPATLSPAINNEWLRNRLGFEGVLLSDDMDMAAMSEKYSWGEMARHGLLSSIDFFLLCQRSENIEIFYRALSDAIGHGGALADMHRKSLGRIDRLFRVREL